MHNLTLGDLTMDTCMYTVVLKHSKGVKAGVGTPVVMSRNNSAFCPLSSMAKYLGWRSSTTTSEPLFVTDAGKAMTRYWFTGLGILCRRCGLDPKLYKAHSFRIGAATS